MRSVPQEDSTCLQWVVRGRVQGVGFRWFVTRVAGKLGLDGTVRNLPDGSVEVVARGKAADLRKLAEGLNRGPLTARVTALEESPGSLAASLTGFGVRQDP